MLVITKEQYEEFNRRMEKIREPKRSAFEKAIDENIKKNKNETTHNSNYTALQDESATPKVTKCPSV